MTSGASGQLPAEPVRRNLGRIVRVAEAEHKLFSLGLVDPKLLLQAIVDGVCAGQQRLFWVLSASLGDRKDYVAAAMVRHAGKDCRDAVRGVGLINQPELGFDVVSDGLHLALAKWRGAHDRADGYAPRVITNRLSDSRPKGCCARREHETDEHATAVCHCTNPSTSTTN